MKEILLICVSSQNVINFRLNLIKSLQSKNYNVSVIAFDDKYKEDIKQLGINLYVVQGSNRGLNPMKVFSYKKQYFNIIKNINPSIVFTFMLTPNLFGVHAAKKAKINHIYSMVEGLGDVFINTGIKWQIIRAFVSHMYKKAFKIVNKVFFLNHDDHDYFVSNKLVDSKKSIIINGIGIDLEHFAFSPLTSFTNVLMVGRMLKTKGVYEYFEAARIIKETHPNINFMYLGPEGNVKLDDLKDYLDKDIVKHLGVTKDVRPYLIDSSLFVLPSYREGLPVSILEAEAIGRPIIASDVAGCKETVKNGYNGFLFEKCNVDEMVTAIINVLNDKNKMIEMGMNSRKYVEKNFDCKVINKKVIDTIEMDMER